MKIGKHCGLRSLDAGCWLTLHPFTRSPVHPLTPSPVAQALPEAFEGVAQGGRSDDAEAVLFRQLVDFDDGLTHQLTVAGFLMLDLFEFDCLMNRFQASRIQHPTINSQHLLTDSPCIQSYPIKSVFSFISLSGEL